MDMNMTYKRIALFYIVISATSFMAGANSGEAYSKVISKDFDANANTTLDVNNKYGAIEIENWDKPSIHIDVKVTVEHKSREEANKLLQMINIDFFTEGDLVKAVTRIDDKFGTSNIWFGNGNIDGKKFSINYKIMVPKTLNINIKNKYGDIMINEIGGYVEVDLKYGNININKLTRGDTKPLNTIIVGYGKASLEECNWLKFSLSYSKASIQRCKALILVSKYSKANIDKASSLVVDSQYDGYNIGSLANLVVSGKYSNYNIQTLSKKLDAEVKYSTIHVNSVSPGFESIRVENSYGPTKLGIEPGASYHLDAYAKYAGIKYPETGGISKITENNSITIKGVIGGGNPKANVNINSSYGGIDLIK
jgi:hypothetical protein